ncbi:hypothetical protein [Stenotrophomonas maltophilia]|uniref:hypothetical protein n=1 Tax=Stenotrophomonas maltophilia TaxID=40324 RepID=UPI00139043DF|nr:hypothetical protein [Stenotrophomonas maltophilia]
MNERDKDQDPKQGIQESRQDRKQDDVAKQRPASAINRCVTRIRAARSARRVTRIPLESWVLQRKNPQIAEIYGFF